MISLYRQFLDEMSGADALAEAIGGTPPQECSTDEKVKFNDTLQSILAAQKRLWICNVCGKEMKTKQRLGLHVEVHIDGTSHTCNLCGKTYKTKNTLQKHNYLSHRKQD